MTVSRLEAFYDLRWVSPDNICPVRMLAKEKDGNT